MAKVKRKNYRRRKKIFISYSWDSNQHKAWVKKLADKLTQRRGVHVILDQYDLKIGSNMNHFMENALKEAEKVLIILTPNYAKKADKRRGGVGHEYSIIDSDITGGINQYNKYLPILRKGNVKISCPSFLKVFVHLDMRNDGEFISKLSELEENILEKFAVIRPPYADNTESIAKKLIKNQKQNARRRKNRKA